MTDAEILNELEEALRSRRIDCERVEDTFNLSQGQGIMAHRAHIDPRPLLDELSEDDDARRREIAGYVSGVKHVLLEPSRSKASEWSFVESAGGLMPSIEVSTFELGVEAAAGEPAWTLDFCDDLRLAYLIHLDRGIRVLTAPQVERWGVTGDRIRAGARSLLFHKTRERSPRAFESYEHVCRLHAGDGHDAARCLVAADAYYSEIDEGFRFALPTQDHFLCIYEADPEPLQELRRAADAVFDEALYPLSRQIFRFLNGKPVPTED